MIDTKAVRALADNWDHDEREFMRELVDALRQCADEIDAIDTVRPRENPPLVADESAHDQMRVARYNAGWNDCLATIKRARKGTT